ncbi:hypothetical protein C4556_03260 [Candidatus Parcubacteria bacterium]|nr:MAG: hypothetical protein C4556_03260 [Candidatus Parcubacteria bacterium]
MNPLNHSWKKLRHAYQNRHEPECVHVLANAYWHILLFATALVVTVFVWYGFWQLIAITGSPEAAQLEQAAARSPLDRAALQGTVSGFSERSKRYEFLTDNPPVVADPFR